MRSTRPRISHRAQVALEFVFLVAIAFSVLLVFSKVIVNKASDIGDKQEYAALRDITYFVQNELYMATVVSSDYYREFDIPTMLLSDIGYTIVLNGNVIISNTSESEFTLNAPQVNGSIQKGTNRINKTGGRIQLN